GPDQGRQLAPGPEKVHSETAHRVQTVCHAFIRSEATGLDKELVALVPARVSRVAVGAYQPKLARILAETYPAKFLPGVEKVVVEPNGKRLHDSAEFSLKSYCTKLGKLLRFSVSG